MKHTEIVFIRHGLTQGNLEKRYIGRTDEGLCERGRQELLVKAGLGALPQADRVYCSPMLRCVETVEILYPSVTDIIAVEEFREMDFGAFEGKNYLELKGEPAYQAYLDSGGLAAFPEAETREAFTGRCREGFCALIPGLFARKSAAFVVHGGTIMALMSAFARPQKPYFDWQCKNGCGCLCHLVGNADNWRMEWRGNI